MYFKVLIYGASHINTSIRRIAEEHTVIYGCGRGNRCRHFSDFLADPCHVRKLDYE